MNTKQIKESVLYLKTPEDLKFLAESLGKHAISYSQLTTYLNCPFAWKLDYVDKIRLNIPSIHMTFGTAMHRVLQELLIVMYNQSAKAAEKLDYKKMLHNYLLETYNKDYTKYGKHFSNAIEIKEFYQDGVEILEDFIKKRSKYFSLRGVELLGVEIPMIIETDSNQNVLLNGFLDIVLYDKEEKQIKIIDIKTSTKGWSKWQKADTTKTAQLLLYKKYFSKQYNIPIDDVKIEYFIVKRKLYENVDFPQRRVQLFEPANGKVSINKSEKDLTSFVSTCFNSDGTFNKNATYRKALSDKCKFCNYKGTDHCPESK
jgi:hypothetical protein